MKINWYGNCSFLIQDSFGRRIILDPINLEHTKDIVQLNPKVIMISHEYNTNISDFLSSNKIIHFNNTTSYITDYLSINTYYSYHDKLNGLKRGSNIIYKFTFDAISFCSLGHLGHKLSKNIIDALKNIDILFIPIGGHLTINGYEAADIVKKINPKIVIPMYYRHKDSLTYLDTIKNFLFSMNSSLVESLCTFNFREINNNATKIVLLKPYS